ncbi:sensor histidine kinase [Actinoplanes couchii]|uniref:sensor histidine kinase n=1 Tax=Actinoplanes couchii TaxID=403638 RepID=UPI0023B2B6D8|nr:HAMP domain-containing sensor histidine kinase [Actinoplanes couchii]MDR6317242.1 two-component system sensor histidine kinase VanS [Actinoplanes couchii]
MWIFLLSYVPDRLLIDPVHTENTGVFPVRSNLLRIFAPPAAAVLLLLLVFGLVGGWFLAGRMLAPLVRITKATRTAAGGSLTHRIGPTGRRDEFGELAVAFDVMLERLEAHVGEQRRFAANASHELRTPLAISRTILEVARHDPTPEHIERLHAVNTRAIDLTEALLLLSRASAIQPGGPLPAEGDLFPAADVDLSLLVEEAVETLLPLAEQRGLAIEVTGEPARTRGSAELLARMATNLVQNAIVHNLPTGGTVTAHTEERGDVSVLRIENTGRTLPPSLMPSLIEPFQRGAERTRTADHAGAGLGLAIVHSVVRAHGGALDLAACPGGGLLVTVHLTRS